MCNAGSKTVSYSHIFCFLIKQKIIKIFFIFLKKKQIYGTRKKRRKKKTLIAFENFKKVKINEFQIPNTEKNCI
jgi:hypothetical protein